LQRRLLFLLLLGIGLSLIVAIAGHDRGTLGDLSLDEFGGLAYYGALVIFVGGAVLVMARQRPSQALEAALFWSAIGFVLVFAYSYRSELGAAGERVLSELMPGRVTTRGERNVDIVRGRGGDFQVAAQVNGSRVAMVLDTGASAVVLTQDAAKAAGLPIEVLSYTVQVETANGRTHAASVTLDRVAVGGIIERSVPALVAQPGQLRTSLLGMSFLNRLESWQVRGDRLMMRGYP
jgi:aspartyl protease family protein